MQYTHENIQWIYYFRRTYDKSNKIPWKTLSWDCYFRFTAEYVSVGHRRRIYTEEKTNVVAGLIQFLAALAVLHQDDMRKGWIYPNFQTAATTFALSSV